MAAGFDAATSNATWKKAHRSKTAQSDAIQRGEVASPNAGREDAPRAATKASGKLKWRAAKGAPRKGSAPRELKPPAEAAPVTELTLVAPAQNRAGDEALDVDSAAPEATPDDPFSERGVIILTKATESVDPFDDPFGDKEPSGRPSELKLFADADEFQPLDDDRLPGDDRRPAPLPIMPDDEMPRDDTMPRQPDLGEELAQAPPTGVEECPKPSDLLPINEITNDIDPEPGEFPQECPMSEYAFQPRSFAMTTLAWKAGAPCHKPLYFEQPGVERYGHEWSIAGGPFLQPFVSAAHFFVSVPILPYKMGVEPLWECVYPLGFYRPGSCAPYTVGPVPISLRGAVLQGAVVTGLWYVQ